MTPSPAPHPHAPGRGLAPLVLAAFLVACLATLIWVLIDLRRQLARQEQSLLDQQTQLTTILGEVTRFRIEQRADGKGIDALIEKIASYAPTMASVRPGPEMRFAKQELDAVLTAVQSLGPKAFEPLRTRLLGLDPTQRFEEQKWLLEAAAKADPEQARLLTVKVLQGYHADTPTSPRLRWYAGDLLLRLDQPLGQRILREILSYESYRGIDVQRAQPFGISNPGMAQNSTGFHNFVAIYLRSEDPQLADTLMMVMGHAEHDLVTVQECVKALGELKEPRAAKAIEKLYRNPPVISENPLFLNHCLESLSRILGKNACPMFQEELKTVHNEMVANKLKYLLQELGC